jgi:hypothetical protein
MNTKIYKQVLLLAGDLVSAAQKKDQKSFDQYYQELKDICDEHDNTDKDHPVQWETLADFTDDLADAITLYEKALVKAEAINSKDFRSSIGFAIATLQVELGQESSAIMQLEKAKISCNKIADQELKDEINHLLARLTQD